MKYNQVIFNEELHTYTLNGKQLQGITWILKKYINPDKYANVPEDVLNRACERGSRIHKEIECFVKGYPFDEVSNETKLFYGLTNGIVWEEAEYNVTDTTDFASNIDIIDNKNNLYDIKTTSVLDKESLSWQLSIYAYLFELQNEEKAGKLYGVWLHGDKAKLVEVDRIPDDIVKSLLDCARNNEETFDNPLKKVSNIDSNKLAQLYEVEQQIINIESKAKELKTIQDQLRDELLSVMEKQGITKYDSDNISLTYVAPTTRESIDSKKVKEMYPDVYFECRKMSEIKSSLRIKIK